MPQRAGPRPPAWRTPAGPAAKHGLAAAGPGGGGPGPRRVPGPLAGDRLALGGLPGRRPAHLELVYRGQAIRGPSRWRRGRFSIKARLAAPARLADAAARVSRPRGHDARGDARQGERCDGGDQRGLGGLAVERLAVERLAVERLAVERLAVERLAGGSPSAEGQGEPLVGRVRAVGFHPGHRPATGDAAQDSGVGMRRGDRAPGRSEGGGHHVRGVLAGPHHAGRPSFPWPKSTF